MVHGKDPVSDEARSDAYHEMRLILIGVAKLRTTISYSELTYRMTTVTLHVRAPQLYELLRQICRDEAAAERGYLCALVVRKSDGLPGQGFFKMLARNGYDCSDPQACWDDVAAHLYETWGAD